MTCQGCVKAVDAVLKRTPGVTNVEIDLPTKTVVVDADIDEATLQAAIERTGKAVSACSV